MRTVLPVLLLIPAILYAAPKEVPLHPGLFWGAGREEVRKLYEKESTNFSEGAMAAASQKKGEKPKEEFKAIEQHYRNGPLATRSLFFRAGKLFRIEETWMFRLAPEGFPAFLEALNREVGMNASDSRRITNGTSVEKWDTVKTSPPGMNFKIRFEAQ